MPDIAYEQRGYLTENFRLFHLNDRAAVEIGWHYHAFHKIILFLRGKGAYGVEGKRYPLQPGDVILVASGAVHRPEISTEEDYERYVLYISPEYLRRVGGKDDLEICFRRAAEGFDFVARPRDSEGEILRQFRELEKNALDPGFGQELMGQAIFLRLLVTLTRSMEKSALQYVHGDLTDKRIMSVLQYLGRHLTEEITVDELAQRFAVSKYHLMRRFKEETGCTIHGYVSSKRLILAHDLISDGTKPTLACYRSGFQDYSAFSKAYRKQFGTTPRGEKQS